MLPTTSNRGLLDTTSNPSLQTSLGKFSKLSTENRLLSCGTKSSQTSTASLASKRRQELLSSLIKKKRQKINLDLSNRLLNLDLKLQSKLGTSSGSSGSLHGLNLQRNQTSLHSLETPRKQDEVPMEIDGPENILQENDNFSREFLDKFTPAESSVNFNSPDLSLTREQEAAEEQLILKVSFCSFHHSQQ